MPTRTCMSPLRETSAVNRARWASLDETISADALPVGTATPIRPYTGATPTLSLDAPGHTLWHQYTQPHLYDERDIERSAALGAFWSDNGDVDTFVANLIDEAVDTYADTVGKVAWPCPSCRHAVFTRTLDDACPVCS